MVHRRTAISRILLIVTFLLLVSACTSTSAPSSSEPPGSTQPQSTTTTTAPRPTEPATWILDPAFDRPGSDTRDIAVLVTETGCASGQPPGDRLLPPRIVYGIDSIEITFAVTSQWVPGSTVTMSCPQNPAVPYVVTLEEPLGRRELVDGGETPPIDRMQRMQVDPHTFQRAGEAPLAYGGALVGTVMVDNDTGCVRLDTVAGQRAVWWPYGTEVGFDPDEISHFDFTVSEGEDVAVIGGRALPGIAGDRCANDDFLWVGFDVVPATPPPPPGRDPKVDERCYTPIDITFDEWTITVDRSIWCTLDQGYVTVSRAGSLVAEGPTEWVFDTRFEGNVIVDPRTGEMIVAVPDSAISTALDRYRAVLFGDG